jgi:4-amino-4-deoxy-L-arabinose transferase-like glycosyltransferase
MRQNSLFSGLQRLNSRHYLLIITIIFIASRALIFISEKDDFLNILLQQDDGVVYQELSLIWQGEATYESLNRSPFVRVPLYPVFLAVVSKISYPHNIPTVFLIQQVIQYVIIVSVFLYIKRYHSLVTAGLLAITLTLFFDFTLYGFLIRPEVLFSAFILFASIAYLKTFSSKSYLWPLLTGLLFGLATLSKPIAALIFIPLSSVSVFIPIMRKQSPRRGLKHAALIAFSLFIVTSPWLLRNYSLTGSLILQQDTGNIIHATTPGGHWSSFDIQEAISTEGKSSLAIDQEVTALAITRIKQNPSIWIRNSLKNFTFRLWSMGFTDTHLRYFGYSDTEGGYHKSLGASLFQRLVHSINIFSPSHTIHPVSHLYLITNNVIGFSMIPITLLGLILLPFLKPSSRKLFTVLLYFWVLTSFFAFSGSRYMVPLVPILFLILPDYPEAIQKLLRFSKIQTNKNI